MSAACKMNFRWLLLSSTACILIAGGELARAQTPPLRAETLDDSSSVGPLASSSVGPLATSAAGTAVPGTPSTGPGGGMNLSNAAAWTGPEFQWNASILASETYVSNASGIPGASQSDYMSILGFTSDLHEHSRRITLDANYNLTTNFYANGTVPTQISNYLQALGNVDVIPEYLDLDMRVFAQPVVTSNFGAVSADNVEIPGAFRNSYGYFGTPDLHFNWGDFASFKTMPSYGQVFFTIPPGTSTANTIPDLAGPENTTVRSVTEEISSGTDFDRLNWKLVGLLSETDRQQSLLSEKSGTVDGRYALNYEWSLLVTAGYESIAESSGLLHDLTGPVAMGGIGLTLGQNFSFQAEAGERYNSLSFNGNLRYNLSPTSLLTASANDYVQSPEGQLLNNLTGLTALPDGTLTTADQVLENGTASSLTPFNVQSADNPALDQFVSRYQTVVVSFLEDFERTQASLSVFGTRRTLLTAGFTGPGTADSWGVRMMASRNISPLLTATLGGDYSNNEEFGGQASTIAVHGELNYSLSRATSIFLRSSYIDRLSSSSLIALSPLTGSVTDFNATLGIRHTL
jgi:uncharacterized protein (PEP-CTERM system associated)